MAMENIEFNLVTESYALRHDDLDRKDVFEEAFDEAMNNEFRDLVFICQDEHVSYHSEIVSAISPVVRDFVQKSKSCECSSFVKKQTAVFVSLEGVTSDVVEMVMNCVYGRQPMRFSRRDLGEISSLFKMLGIDSKTFIIDNLTQPPLNTFKRKMASDHQNDLKRKKSSEGKHYSGQESSRQEIPNKPVIDKRAETMFKEHKSITMTKVEIKPESRIERLVTNPLTSMNHPSLNIQPENNIQKFLPHLTVTSVKQDQDHADNRVAEEANFESAVDMDVQEPLGQEDAVQETVFQNSPVVEDSVESRENLQIVEKPILDIGESQGELKCPLAFCTTGKTFRVRCEILLHLAYTHYTEQLLNMHPFNRGGSCTLCVDLQKTKIYSANSKKAHMMHVGVTHEVVLDLLPQELRDLLSAMRKTNKRGKPKKKVAQEPTLVSGSFLDSEDVSFENDSFENDSFSNSFEEPTESEPVYDNYNYEDGSAIAGEQYPEASKPYDGVYQAEAETYEDQYQGTPEPYENAYQSEAESYNNHYQEAPAMYETGCEETQETVVNQNNEPYEGSQLSIEVNQYANQDVQLGQSESFSNFQSDGSEGSFLTSSLSQINQVPQDKQEGHALTCHLCTKRSFPKKEDLLFHLTFSHFSKDLLQLHPYIENIDCVLCTNNPNISASISSHLKHMGVVHGEVLQFVTPDVAEQLRLEDTKPEASPNSDEAKDVKEPEENKPEVTNNLTALPKEVPSVQCSLCPNKVRMYSKRSDFLKHLSLGHFGRSILQVNPYQEGHSCRVCQDSSSKVFVPTKKEIHVCHLGVLHGKVFDYLSEDLLEMVKSLPTLKKAAQPKSPDNEVKTNQTENESEDFKTKATLQEEVAN